MTTPAARLPFPRRRDRGFTLLEMVIVMAIIGLVLALALPRMGRLPHSLLVSNAVSGIRIAFQDAGTRARATGQAVRLVLDTEAKKFRVQADAGGAGVVPGLAAPAAPAAGAAGAAGDGPGKGKGSGLLSRLSEYPVTPEVEWQLGAADLSPGELPAYLFSPNGEASGPTLYFSVGKTQFRLDADRLTGRPLIEEAE